MDFLYAVSGNEVTITGYTGSGGDVVVPETIDGLPVTAIGVGAFQNCTSLTSIILPTNLTSIANGEFGRGAFSNCNSLTEVTFQSSATIGDYAFYSCAILKSVILPDSMTYIGTHAFYDCKELTSFSIPSGIKRIENYVFNGCSGLVSVTIPDGVVSIGTSAFSDCTGLTSIVLPDSVISIESGVFVNCSRLSTVIIPDSVVSMGDSVFSGCSGLTSVSVSNSVTAVPDYTFRDCTRLSSFVIPNNVTSIGDSAFSHCTGLTTITILGKVTYIGEYAFYECARLTSVTLPKGVARIGACAFQGCRGLSSFVIPDGVIDIGHSVFSGCTGLTSVTIPNSVISIGSGAFGSCWRLTSITIPNDVIRIENGTFSGCMGLTSVVIPDGVTIIGDNAFSACTRLASVTIPSSVSRIGSFAFMSCVELTEITLPEGVENVGHYAFQGCTKLTKTEIPSSVYGMGEGVFDGTKSVVIYAWPGSCVADYARGRGISIVYLTGSEASIEASLPAWFDFAQYGDMRIALTNKTANRQSIISATDGLVYLFDGLVTGDVYKLALMNQYGYIISEIDDIAAGKGIRSVTFSDFVPVETISLKNGIVKNLSYRVSISTIPGSLKNEIVITKYAGNDEDIVMPELIDGLPVTRIDHAAFENCTSLRNIVLPLSLNSIGVRAFNGCTRLESVAIPNGVTGIETNAFANCTSLVSFTLPKGLFRIEAGVFSECSGLTTVIFHNNVTHIGSGAFSGCSGLASINIPNSVTHIEGLVFRSCSGLVSVTIPNRLDRIEDHFFWGCSALVSATIPNSVTSMGHSVFRECTGLTSITIPDSVTEMGSGVFSGCTGLASITLPAGITSIRGPMFQNCTALTSVLLPAGVTLIGVSAFQNCTGLTAITLPAGVTVIELNAFENCSALTAVTIPGGVTCIEVLVFASCRSLTSVTILGGVTSIENGAFRDCVNLERIEIPLSVESIADDAFVGSNNVVIYTWLNSYASNYGVVNSIPVVFITEAVSIEVSLPSSLNPWQYGDAKITLTNKTTNTQFALNVTDRLTYSFGGLTVGNVYKTTLTNRLGYVLSEIDNIVAEEGVKSVAFTDFFSTRTVFLRIFDNNGANVTAQAIVKWYSESGSYLAQGGGIAHVVAGARVQYKIELNSALGSQFVNPPQTDYTVVDGDNVIEITLAPIQAITISGTVKNAETGGALSGAAVSISQMLNGQHPKTVVGMTDNNGVFSVQVFNGAGTVTVSNYNFIKKSIAKETFAVDEDLGEIMLSPVSGAMIELQTSFTRSAMPNETLDRFAIYHDYHNLHFAVYNQTRGKSITDFIYQYPHIVLPDGADANETIRISVSGGANDFNTVQADVTLDGALKATAALDMVQHGLLRAAFSSSGNKENVALVYGANGELVEACDFRLTSVSTGFLPDGNYTVVFMGKSRFFNSIQSLSDLTTANLVQDVDYAIRKVEIKSGIISLIGDISIPRFDEGGFYYTDNDKTLFSVNKASAITGSFFVLRSQLAFRDAYKNQVSDVKLIAHLPKNCAFVENSVIYGANNTPAKYLFNGDTLTVPLINIEDIVRFCVVPQEGKYAVDAFVEFVMDGETIRQPIGAAGFEATGMKTFVPERTGRRTVTATGATIPGTVVILYDNEIEVGRTQTAANGNWSLTFDFVKAFTNSYHRIYAEAITSAGVKVKSETKRVRYNPSYIDLSSVKMHYYGNVYLFDFFEPKNNTPFYIYAPLRSDFTFTVEFTENDPDLVSDVYVNVFNSEGRAVSLPAAYDPIKNLWVAEGEFGLNHIPANVGVNYYCNRKPAVIFDAEMMAQHVETVEKFDSDILDALIREINLLLALEGKKFAIEYLSSDIREDGTRKIVSRISYEDAINMENISFYSGYLVENFDSSEVNTADPSLWEIKDTKGNIYYVRHIEEYARFGTTLIDITNGKKIFLGYSWDDPSDVFSLYGTLGELGYGFTLVATTLGTVGLLLTLSGVGSPVGLFLLGMSAGVTGIAGSVLSGIDVALEIKEAERRLDLYCSDHPNYQALKKNLWEITIKAGTLYGGEVTNGYSGIFGTFVTSAAVSRAHASATFLVSMAQMVAGTVLSDHLYQFNQNVSDGCHYDPNLGLGIAFKIDPSGYVYEAVESNRLPGVTTTAFYKTTEEDMYGDEYEVVNFWEAAPYGEVNPLITDEIGWYEWDVPEGLWQVKYEKDGYQTTYSDWLPVPPPQLEVNVGMTTYAPPNVCYVNGYERYVEVVFDRYMDITTIDTSNVFVVDNGEQTEIVVEYADKEVDPTDEDRYYARVVHIKPAEGQFELDSEVALSIEESASTYAGVPMRSGFAQAVTIKPGPEMLVLPDELELDYGESVTIEVSITPFGAAVGRTILARSSSVHLVTVTPEAITNDEGVATFSVIGELTGSADLIFSVENTQTSGSVKVHVALPEERSEGVKAETPVANLPSGEVEKGTWLILSTATPCATIYYTTDSTCPRNENGSRVAYSGPIEINEDMVIAAVAYKEGMAYSEVLGVFFTVRPRFNEYTVAEGSSTTGLGNVLVDSNAGPGATVGKVLYSVERNVPANNGLLQFATVLGGIVVIRSDGTFHYIAPIIDHSAGPSVDSFQYCVKDADGNMSKPRTVNITLTDSVPVAADDFYRLTEAHAALRFSANVMTNDRQSRDWISRAGGDGQTESIQNIVWKVRTAAGAEEVLVPAGSYNPGGEPTVTTANGGRVWINRNGRFEYVPSPSFEGKDTFQYQLNDGDGTPSEWATVTFSVPGPAMPPGIPD